MRARNPRRPLCQREIRVVLGSEGKRVKQNQTDMVQLRRGCLQGVKISRCGGYLTARMRFRHPHVPALSRHLLTALPLGCRHRSIGHRTCHHRQCGEQYCQSENTDSTHECQQGYCSGNCELDATGGRRFKTTLVTHLAGNAQLSQEPRRIYLGWLLYRGGLKDVCHPLSPHARLRTARHLQQAL